MDFYRDAAGDFRASGEDALAGFLESDLQGAPHLVADLLDCLDRGESWTGNAWMIETRAGHVYLEPLFSDQPATVLDHQSFCAVIRRWGAFLDAGGRTD